MLTRVNQVKVIVISQDHFLTLKKRESQNRLQSAVISLEIIRNLLS
jgi:hypothetical protein